MRNRVKKIKIQKSRYEMYDFIASIEAQAVLWHRDHDDYHNRERREEAWHKVARHLDEKFDKCTEGEKRRTVQLLTRRWKNTRDCYFRALRNTSKRTYIYEQRMAFLLSNQPPKCPRNSHKTNDDDDDDGDDDGDTIDHIESSNDTSQKCLDTKPTIGALVKAQKRYSSTQQQKAQTAKSRTPNTESEASNHSDPLLLAKYMKISCDERSLSPQAQKFDECIVEENSEAISQNTTKIPVVNMATTLTNTSTLPNCNILEPDPDQAFFDSIKPIMRSMNMNQKLDFQIEVLKLLKTFRTSQ